MKLSFSGQGVLVLGGTCDLALCLAEQMMESGLHPLLTFKDEAGRDRINTRFGEEVGGYDAVYLNLTEPESIDVVFSTFEEEIDYVVDFAHGRFESLVASANTRKSDRYFAGNISSRAWLLRMAGRAFLKKGHGRLVYISSAAVERANPGQGFYAAAKLASEALYRNLGLELADHDITTVSLRLGYVDAGRGKAYLDAVGREGTSPAQASLWTPLTAVIVAETILFYLSNSAVGFNATEVRIDKGRTAAK